MAYPSTEIDRFRGTVQQTVDNMRRIDALLAIVEDHGADDAARQAFFQAEFGAESNNPDLTWAEFGKAIIALREIRTAWNSNKYAIAKLLK